MDKFSFSFNFLTQSLFVKSILLMMLHLSFVGYAQVPVNDQALNQSPNRSISINIRANDDTGGLPPENIQLLPPAGAVNTGADAQGDINQYYITTEGSWFYNQTNGTLTFLPIKDFLGTAKPLTYRYRRNDNTFSSTATVTVSITCAGNDSDTDGIFNNCDLDDDNDGIETEIECYVPLNTEEFNGTFGTITGTNRNLAQPPVGYTYGGTGAFALNSEATYVVTSYSNSNNVHSSSQHWQNLRGHTNGAVNDAYLAVNGSTTQSVLYDQDFSTSVIQANTNYRLSLWAINAITSPSYTGSPANIEIRMIGNPGANVIASVSTGDMYPNQKPVGSDLEQLDWHQAILIFNSGTYTSYRLEVKNLSITNFDNDFAIDDIILSKSTCLDTDNDGIVNGLDLDSDGDGCEDAIEGDENVVRSHLKPDGSINTVTNGGINGSAVPNLVNTGGAADIGGDVGQGIGSSQNSGVNACVCYQNQTTAGTTLDTKVGISGLRLDNSNGWPEVRKGAWIALESASKGFVINRIPTTAQVNALPNPIEGMMVYDEEADCLKVFTIKNNEAVPGWHCFNKQGCPGL